MKTTNILDKLKLFQSKRVNPSVEVTLLHEENKELKEENNYLKEKLLNVEKINLNMMSEKALLSFNDYREINSLNDKIKNLREKVDKDNNDFYILRTLVSRFEKLSTKIKNDNTMQNLLKNEHLISFMYSLLKERQLVDLIDKFREEKHRLKHQKWNSITKI